MLRLIWTYYAPDEVARAVEHIELMVERGATAEAAASTWTPRPSKYPTEVSLRAFLHRLLHE